MHEPHAPYAPHRRADSVPHTAFAQLKCTNHNRSRHALRRRWRFKGATQA